MEDEDDVWDNEYDRDTQGRDREGKPGQYERNRDCDENGWYLLTAEGVTALTEDLRKRVGDDRLTIKWAAQRYDDDIKGVYNTLVSDGPPIENRAFWWYEIGYVSDARHPSRYCIVAACDQTIMYMTHGAEMTIHAYKAYLWKTAEEARRSFSFNHGIVVDGEDGHHWTEEIKDEDEFRTRKKTW